MLKISDETKEIFSYAEDKAIVDFTNNIVVLDELNESHKNRGRSQYFLSMITGKEKIRQENFNDYLIGHLKHSREFILELMNDIENHSMALMKINYRLQNTQEGVSKIAENLIDFRNEVKNEFAKIQDDLNRLDKRLKELEQHSKIDKLCSAWKAGYFNSLSPLARCYHIADSLYWDSVKLENRTYLETELINCLKHDFGTKTKLISRNEWLTSGEKNDEICKTLQYVGDWTLDDPVYNDTALIATQNKAFLELEENRYIAPMTMSIEQAVKRIITEVYLREI